MSDHRPRGRAPLWLGLSALSVILIVGMFPVTSAGMMAVGHPSAHVAVVTGPDATPPLQVTSFTVIPSSVTQGSSFTANVTVSGGAPPYSYSWSNTPPPCTPGNVSNWQCSPSQTGLFTLGVNVVDHNGTHASSSQPLTVNAPLAINSLSISPNPVTKGSQFSVNAAVSGGIFPYTFTWNPIPPSCVAGNTSTWQCSVSSTGEYTVSLNVRDNAGTQASISRSVNVTGGSGNNGNGNGSNSHNSNGSGFNLSSFGSFIIYALIAGIVGFALLVALTIGVIAIAVILARRLPRPPRGALVCGSCQGKAPAGSKFCPACGTAIPPAK